ncbi:MAG: hydroxyacylglutathione hydrolase [Proteobacteria bacterium]|nr:hydroxyacylglutathione hydrolase [Pseudomonadota bacterium]
MHLQALPAFDDNYIWTVSADDGSALIVDPGQASPVFAAAEQGLRPLAVLLTHHHDDHIGGTPALLQRWPELPIYAPFDDRISTATERVGDGDRVQIGPWSLDVLAVPGHTRSHVAFHLVNAPGDGLLFCGDALFSLGCGRLFEGTPAQMHGSLSRLAALPDRTAICCGHEYTLSNAAFACVVEPDNQALRQRVDEVRALRHAGRPSLPVTLAEERAGNPFLRTDCPAVIAAVHARLGRPPRDAVETLAELRRWKDGFRA